MHAEKILEGELYLSASSVIPILDILKNEFEGLAQVQGETQKVFLQLQVKDFM